jgi:NitT/TauT family transport system substrate-binding protein
MFLLCLMGAAGSAATALPTVTVAALKFGSVNWELAVIDRHQLDRKHGFKLNVLELVSSNATAVSLQSGAADLMVSDWLWVAKQHRSERFYRYYPYSSAVGELMVPCEYVANGLEGLKGKRLGVAGGSEGKNWLLFRAYTRQQFGYDLADEVVERFAAPPLLNGLLQAGQLDAVLNYWQYSARLQNNGYCSLLSLQQVLTGLGLNQPLPMLGWVFKQQWAEQHGALANGFLAASYEAKQLLRESDQEWQWLKNMMPNIDEPLLVELRKVYRAGIPSGFGAAEINAINKIYRLAGLAATTDKSKVNSTPVPQQIFWREFTPSQFASKLPAQHAAAP